MLTCNEVAFIATRIMSQDASEQQVDGDLFIERRNHVET